MNDLQTQLNTESGNTTKIRILGINQDGHQAGNSDAVIQNAAIPWLQDITPSPNVWASWGGSQFSLHILDTFNVRQSVWSHISKPLAVPNDSNWNQLKALLKQIAGEP